MSALPLDVERLALLGYRLAPTTRRKKGMFTGWLDAATYDLDVLEGWARQYRGCNWAVVPRGSDVWALDVDVVNAEHKADGVAALAEMVRANAPLPARPHGRSGGGGHLLVFRDDGHPIRCKSGWPVPGLDPRAGRVVFTVAPSVHKNGTPYKWTVAPWELAAPAAPEWLLKAVAPPPEPARPPIPFIATAERAERRLRRAVDTVVGAPSGTANDTLNREAFAVARYVAAGKLGEADAVEALYAAARARKVPHYEAKNTIKSGFLNGLRHPFAEGNHAR